VSPARGDVTGEPEAPASAKASPRSVLEAPRRPIARYRPAVILAGVLGVLLLVGIGFLIAFGGGGGGGSRGGFGGGGDRPRSGGFGGGDRRGGFGGGGDRGGY